jgi:hypothetical protein
MSPEQIKNLSTLDHRSDLYSMGMTMYELLAGRLPFDRDASEFTTMRRIVEDRFEPPDQFNADIPALLTGVILKALEKNPDDRFQSAAEMLAVVEALDVDQPVTRTLVAEKKSPPVAFKRKRRSLWPVLATLIGVVLLGIAGYFVGSKLLNGSSAPEDEDSEVATVENIAVPVTDERATLTVETDPVGALVRINGVEAGVTPVREFALDGETVSLHVEKPGFLPMDTTFHVAGGSAGVINVTLKSPRPQPPVHYATVNVGAEGEGTIHLGAQSIEPGSHRVRAGEAQRIT